MYQHQHVNITSAATSSQQRKAQVARLVILPLYLGLSTSRLSGATSSLFRALARMRAMTSSSSISIGTKLRHLRAPGQGGPASYPLPRSLRTGHNPALLIVFVTVLDTKGHKPALVGRSQSWWSKDDIAHSTHLYGYCSPALQREQHQLDQQNRVWKQHRAP